MRPTGNYLVDFMYLYYLIGLIRGITYNKTFHIIYKNTGKTMKMECSCDYSWTCEYHQEAIEMELALEDLWDAIPQKMKSRTKYEKLLAARAKIKDAIKFYEDQING